MIQIVYIVSLVFIAGAQARISECEGNKPWLLKENARPAFIESIINSHLERIDELRNKTYKRLLALDMKVAHLYIESMFATKWENMKDIPYKQAAVCYNVSSRDTKRKLEEFTSKKQAELKILYEQYPKVQYIHHELDEGKKEGYGNRNEFSLAQEASLNAYKDICKLSGHVTPAMDKILKAVDSMEQTFISRAWGCYNLIYNDRIDDESADSVKKWLRQTFPYKSN